MCECRLIQESDTSHLHLASIQPQRGFPGQTKARKRQPCNDLSAQAPASSSAMSLLEGDLCGDWEDEDKGSGWDGDSRSGYSDSSGPFQSSQADRLGGPETGYASNIPHTSSTASASSTVSYFNLEPYSTRAGSGVCSISPQSPASREPSGSPSESSTDPILLQSASHSTLPVRQVWWATSDSDTVSGSERSNVLEEDGRAHTPETNTSEADLEDEDFSGPDEATTVSIPNDEEAFLGLEFPSQ